MVQNAQFLQDQRSSVPVFFLQHKSSKRMPSFQLISEWDSVHVNIDLDIIGQKKFQLILLSVATVLIFVNLLWQKHNYFHEMGKEIRSAGIQISLGKKVLSYPTRHRGIHTKHTLSKHCIILGVRLWKEKTKIYAYLQIAKHANMDGESWTFLAKSITLNRAILI